LLRFIGDSGALRPHTRIYNPGDPAQSARGVSGRDSRQTTIRRTTNRARVQTRVLPR